MRSVPRSFLNKILITRRRLRPPAHMQQHLEPLSPQFSRTHRTRDASLAINVFASADLWNENPGARFRASPRVKSPERIHTHIVSYIHIAVTRSRICKCMCAPLWSLDRQTSGFRAGSAGAFLERACVTLYAGRSLSLSLSLCPPCV